MYKSCACMAAMSTPCMLEDILTPVRLLLVTGCRCQ
jgi:hypothetical protein